VKLWKEGSSENSPGVAVRMRVKDVLDSIDRKVASRGVRAVNALRNAELEVLRGQRSGKRYRKPHTKKAMYTASAPGEPPARRTGNLRLHWNGEVKTADRGNGRTAVTAVLESQEKYDSLLENGTRKIEPRPFVDKIIEKAEPEIKRICSEPYT